MIWLFSLFWILCNMPDFLNSTLLCFGLGSCMNYLNKDRKTVEGFGDEWERFAFLMERLGMLSGKAAALPLVFYRYLSFYTMRTDALNRFSTRLEQRFTRKQIEAMILAAGLTNIRFSKD